MNIKVEAFNEAPTANELAAYIKANHLDEILEVADAQRTYWQNGRDTLVLRVKDASMRPGLTFDQGVALGQLAAEFGADEFNRIVEDYQTYYRIWWD